MADQIKIPAQVTITVSAPVVMKILELFGKEPYAVIAPMIAEIEPQLITQQVKEPE